MPRNLGIKSFRFCFFKKKRELIGLHACTKCAIIKKKEKKVIKIDGNWRSNFFSKVQKLQRSEDN